MLREACSEVKERNGRVVAVDPRNTETVRRNEHIGINAGTDAWLLSAMLQTIVAENLVDHEWMRGKIEGFDAFASELDALTPELAAGRTGIAADDIRQLARDFANADSACVIGRTGTCTQQFAEALVAPPAPALHLGMFVGGVVVGDQVQAQVARGLPVEVAQKVQPLPARVLGGGAAEDLAVQVGQRGEQRDGAVAFVVVRDEKAGLSALQGLALALPAAAQRQRSVRRRTRRVEDDPLAHFQGDARLASPSLRLKKLNRRRFRGLESSLQ